MDIFEKFFHIWNLWGPMHLSINVWSWSGKKSESWYSLIDTLYAIKNPLHRVPYKVDLECSLSHEGAITFQGLVGLIPKVFLGPKL